MLKQKDTTYIYPVLAYQPTIMPLYSSAKIIDLDTTAKRMSIPVIIPDSVCRYFAYLPAMPLDSVFLRKENIVIYSPLMPTTKKGRYVIQKTVFTPTMYPDTRLSAMFFDYYFVKGDSCIYLEREEMEMIAY